MSVPVRDFLKARRDRALGTILGWSEQNLYKGMTQPQREAFREKVFEALNTYHDTVLDLVKAEDGIRNDAVVAALEKLELAVRDGRVPTRVQSGV